MRLLTTLLGLAAAACGSPGGEGLRGWVVDGAWEAGDVVRLAWAVESPEMVSLRFTGEVPIEEGIFDVDALLDLGGWEPALPAMSCTPDVTIVWAYIVATPAEIQSGDLDPTELDRVAKAGSWKHVAVWASADVPRESIGGQEFGSSLRAGAQIMRQVECRYDVSCPQPCVEPVTEDELVILDRGSAR